MNTPLSLQEIALRAGLAAAMGLCIGWDRERHNKAAGLRTMALVSLGSAGMVLASVEVSAAMAAEGTPFDPMRVAAGVVGGVGFLGAGSIIHASGTVRGLTTAATIWAASGLGIACGLGLYRLAGVLFVLVLIILIALQPLKGAVLPEGDQRADRDDHRQSPRADHTPRSDDPNAAKSSA